ncbi:hypothetical protein BG261_02900 [Floricoccus tropicus]|uniref:Uncharacterized protein n=1 Tax=Floricoccus tropicus TaxID=1859473 RepID=A0A1E8GPK8_9LACT|nr:hypothetical protein [Floricoccus tropicus]OFI49543.1 hypothetical protein BG261_02900 [Floricoccus tropicus]
MKRITKTLLIITLLISAITLTGCKRTSEEQNKRRVTLDVVTIVPIGDSDKPAQIIKDSETGMEYFLYDGHMTPRLYNNHLYYEDK